MVHIISNQEDFMGVPPAEQKNVFYDRLYHQMRLLIQALKNPHVDQDQVNSCMIDVARGACYCAKRWMDESFAHVKLFYNLQESNSSVLNDLHQARLAIIEEISRVGYHGNWTHTSAKFRHMLQNVRGIFDSVTAYNDQLGAEISLAQLLSLFDRKNTPQLLIMTILASLNSPQNTLEKKTLIHSELRDVVTGLSQEKIEETAVALLQQFKKMCDEGATEADLRAFLLEKDICWSAEKIQEQWSAGLQPLFAALQDEVTHTSFAEIHDDLLEKNPDGDYRLFNKQGVEDPYGSRTHYRSLASVFLLLKHQALRPFVPFLSPSPYSTPL
jgi:hypothetical protein